MRSISEEVFEYNTNFEDDLNDPKIKLKYSALNLRWKMKELNSDILEIENNICQALDNITEFNINPTGYEIISSLFDLGLYYNNSNTEKSDFYFNKIDREWSKLSINTVSNYFKKIGDLYYSNANNKKSIYWYEKGLKINPKLPVIKILQKIKKEMN